MEENRDLEQEAAQFREAYPQVEELTEEVAAAWAGGTPLKEAYEAGREPEAAEEAAPPAAVAPVTGQGAADQPRKDDFLSGLELDSW